MISMVFNELCFISEINPFSMWLFYRKAIYKIDKPSTYFWKQKLLSSDILT